MTKVSPGTFPNSVPIKKISVLGKTQSEVTQVPVRWECLGRLLKTLNFPNSQDVSVWSILAHSQGLKFLSFFLWTLVLWFKAAKIVTESGGGNFYCLINNIIEGHNSTLATKYPKCIKHAKLSPRYG